jgi:integrase
VTTRSPILSGLATASAWLLILNRLVTPEPWALAVGFPLAQSGGGEEYWARTTAGKRDRLGADQPSKHAMKPDTIAKARTMLSSVLLDGLSYREAGAPFGVGRSTVERSIKTLVLEVARERGIPELDEDGLSCLPRLRQFREPVLRAVAEYTPAHPRRKRITLLEPDEIAAGANRVRLRSENANRDVALIYVLFCTGAKPIEIARLEVRDYLNSDGSIRERSEMRPETAVNGRSRPLFFTSSRACAAVDAYLVERRRRKLGVAGTPTTVAEAYRGLVPSSALFLTERGWPFEIGERGPNDQRETCRLMIATLRSIFRRAGWTGVTAQSARRVVARRLADKGADGAQVGEILGLSSSRAVRRLLGSNRRPLENLARELV